MSARHGVSGRSTWGRRPTPRLPGRRCTHADVGRLTRIATPGPHRVVISVTRYRRRRRPGSRVVCRSALLDALGSTVGKTDGRAAKAGHRPVPSGAGRALPLARSPQTRWRAIDSLHGLESHQVVEGADGEQDVRCSARNGIQTGRARSGLDDAPSTVEGDLAALLEQALSWRRPRCTRALHSGYGHPGAGQRHRPGCARRRRSAGARRGRSPAAVRAVGSGTGELGRCWSRVPASGGSSASWRSR